MASFIDIWRARRCSAPPPSAASPTRGSGSANSAWSDAIARSQAATISTPPPRHRPFTAAITGFHRSNRLVMPAKPSGRIVVIARHGERFQVGAHAERAFAGAGDDRDPQCRVGGIKIECAVELDMRGEMQRIEHLGTIDRDRQDGVLAIQSQILEAGHGRHIHRSIGRATTGKIEGEPGREAAFRARDPAPPSRRSPESAGSAASGSCCGHRRCAPASFP